MDTDLARSRGPMLAESPSAVSSPAPELTAQHPPREAGLVPALRLWLERNRFLVMFALLASFMGTSVGMAHVTTSLYSVHLGSSATWLGLIAGAQSIGVVFMSLPVGMLVDRLGPVRPFVAGTVLVGTLYALLAHADSPLWLATGT